MSTLGNVAAVAQQLVAAAQDTVAQSRIKPPDNQVEWEEEQKSQLEALEIKMKQQREKRIDVSLLQEQINSLLENISVVETVMHEERVRVGDLMSDKEEIETKISAAREDMEILRSRLPNIHHDIQHGEKELREKEQELLHLQENLELKQRLLDDLEESHAQPLKTSEGNYVSSLEMTGQINHQLTSVGSLHVLKKAAQQALRSAPSAKWSMKGDALAEPHQSYEEARKRIRAYERKQLVNKRWKILALAVRRRQLTCVSHGDNTDPPPRSHAQDEIEYMRAVIAKLEEKISFQSKKSTSNDLIVHAMRERYYQLRGELGVYRKMVRQGALYDIRQILGENNFYRRERIWLYKRLYGHLDDMPGVVLVEDEDERPFEAFVKEKKKVLGESELAEARAKAVKASQAAEALRKSITQLTAKNSEKSLKIVTLRRLLETKEFHDLEAHDEFLHPRSISAGEQLLIEKFQKEIAGIRLEGALEVKRRVEETKKRYTEEIRLIDEKCAVVEAQYRKSSEAYSKLLDDYMTTKALIKESTAMRDKIHKNEKSLLPALTKCDATIQSAFKLMTGVMVEALNEMTNLQSMDGIAEHRMNEFSTIAKTILTRHNDVKTQMEQVMEDFFHKQELERTISMQFVPQEEAKRVDVKGDDEVGPPPQVSRKDAEVQVKPETRNVFAGRKEGEFVQFSAETQTPIPEVRHVSVMTNTTLPDPPKGSVTQEEHESVIRELAAEKNLLKQEIIKREASIISQRNRRLVISDVLMNIVEHLETCVMYLHEERGQGIDLVTHLQNAIALTSATRRPSSAILRPLSASCQTVKQPTPPTRQLASVMTSPLILEKHNSFSELGRLGSRASSASSRPASPLLTPGMVSPGTVEITEIPIGSVQEATFEIVKSANDVSDTDLRRKRVVFEEPGGLPPTLATGKSFRATASQQQSVLELQANNEGLRKQIEHLESLLAKERDAKKKLEVSRHQSFMGLVTTQSRTIEPSYEESITVEPMNKSSIFASFVQRATDDGAESPKSAKDAKAAADALIDEWTEELIRKQSVGAQSVVSVMSDEETKSAESPDGSRNPSRSVSVVAPEVNSYEEKIREMLRQSTRLKAQIEDERFQARAISIRLNTRLEDLKSKIDELQSENSTLKDIIRVNKVNELNDEIEALKKSVKAEQTKVQMAEEKHSLLMLDVDGLKRQIQQGATEAERLTEEINTLNRRSREFQKEERFREKYQQAMAEAAEQEKKHQSAIEDMIRERNKEREQLKQTIRDLDVSRANAVQDAMQIKKELDETKLSITQMKREAEMSKGDTRDLIVDKLRQEEIIANLKKDLSYESGVAERRMEAAKVEIKSLQREADIKDNEILVLRQRVQDVMRMQEDILERKKEEARAERLRVEQEQWTLKRKITEHVAVINDMSRMLEQEKNARVADAALGAEQLRSLTCQREFWAARDRAVAGKFLRLHQPLMDFLKLLRESLPLVTSIEEPLSLQSAYIYFGISTGGSDRLDTMSTVELEAVNQTVMDTITNDAKTVMKMRSAYDDWISKNRRNFRSTSPTSFREKSSGGGRSSPVLLSDAQTSGGTSHHVTGPQSVAEGSRAPTPTKATRTSRPGTTVTKKQRSTMSFDVLPVVDVIPFPKAGDPEALRIFGTGRSPRHLISYPELLDERPMTAVARPTAHTPVKCSFAEFAKQKALDRVIKRGVPMDEDHDRKLRVTRSTLHLHSVVNPEDIPRVSTPNNFRPDTPPITREDILRRSRVDSAHINPASSNNAIALTQPPKFRSASAQGIRKK